MTSVFGDNLAFTDTSLLEFGIASREIKSFRQASAEAAMSRLYGGIHFRFDNDLGIESGKRVGELIVQRLTMKKIKQQPKQTDMKKIILASISLITISVKVNAQGCVAIRGGGSSCNVSGQQIEAGSWQFNMGYRYFKSFRHFKGREEQKERLKQNTEVINWQHLLDLSVPNKSIPAGRSWLVYPSE